MTIEEVIEILTKAYKNPKYYGNIKVFFEAGKIPRMEKTDSIK